MAATLLTFAPVILSLVAAALLFGAEQELAVYILSAVLMAAAAGTVFFRHRFSAPWPAKVGSAAIVLITMGQLFTPEPVATLPDLLALYAAGAVYIVMAALGANTTEALRVQLGLQAGFLLVAVIGFVDFVVSPGTLFGQVKTFHEARLTTPFLSANTAAAFYGMGLLFGLSSVLKIAREAEDRRDPFLGELVRRGTLALILILFCLACLALTGSRAGAASVLVAGIVLMVWERRGRQDHLPVLIFGGLSVIAAGVILFVSGDILGERVAANMADDAGRLVLWKASMDAFKEAPFFGHGFGRWDAAIAPHVTAATAPVLSQQGAAHNLLLQWLVQAGLVGTLAGLSLPIMILVQLWRGLSRRRRMRTLLKTVIAVMLALMLHGTLDYALELPAIVWWFAAILGLGAGVSDGGTAAADHRPIY